jgi:hypothetical protein
MTTPVPEASGAAWLTLEGKPELLVISDSGNHGMYGIVDPETGATIEQGKVPLREGSDDLEGLAARGELIYGLSSAGWMRAWRRSGAGFELVDGPYPLGPVDLPNGKAKRELAGPGMVCPLEGTNCGRNYEGLAIAPQAPATAGACAGFAAAKADGHLYCLVEKAGRFSVDRTRAIEIANPGVLADAAFSDDGTLWAADNAFGFSTVYRVDNWADPAHAHVVSLGPLGVGFPEVIAVRGDAIIRMSDTGGAPSLMAKFRCRPAAR